LIIRAWSASRASASARASACCCAARTASSVASWFAVCCSTTESSGARAERSDASAERRESPRAFHAITAATTATTSAPSAIQSPPSKQPPDDGSDDGVVLAGLSRPARQGSRARHCRPCRGSGRRPGRCRHRPANICAGQAAAASSLCPRRPAVVRRSTPAASNCVALKWRRFQRLRNSDLVSEGAIGMGEVVGVPRRLTRGVGREHECFVGQCDHGRSKRGAACDTKLLKQLDGESVQRQPPLAVASSP
jgi:hypothetical protein